MNWRIVGAFAFLVIAAVAGGAIDTALNGSASVFASTWGFVSGTIFAVLLQRAI